MRARQCLCAIVMLPFYCIFLLYTSMEKKNRRLQWAGTASAALHLFCAYGIAVFAILDNNGEIFHDGIDQAKGRYDLCGAVRAGPASSYPTASMVGESGTWQISVNGRTSTFFVRKATVYCQGFCDGKDTGTGTVPFVIVNLGTAMVLAIIVGGAGQWSAFGIGRTKCAAPSMLSGCIAKRSKLLVACSAAMFVLLLAVALGYARTAQSGCQVHASSVYASLFFGWSMVMALTVTLLGVSLGTSGAVTDSLTGAVSDKSVPDVSYMEKKDTKATVEL